LKARDAAANLATGPVATRFRLRMTFMRPDECRD
jgi:hypothetical protein